MWELWGDRNFGLPIDLALRLYNSLLLRTSRDQQVYQEVCLSHRNSVCLSVRPSVRLSVTLVDQAKTVQARITKSLPSAAWKSLVSGTVKFFS